LVIIFILRSITTSSSQKDVQQLKQSEKPKEVPKIYHTVEGKLCKLDNIDKNGNTFYSVRILLKLMIRQNI
jgi:hypothetical protein